VCAAVGTNPVLLAIRESVAEDMTPCTNPDSSTGICVAGACTVRLVAFVILQCVFSTSDHHLYSL